MYNGRYMDIKNRNMFEEDIDQRKPVGHGSKDHPISEAEHDEAMKLEETYDFVADDFLDHIYEEMNEEERPVDNTGTSSITNCNM